MVSQRLLKIREVRKARQVINMIIETYLDYALIKDPNIKANSEYHKTGHIYIILANNGHVYKELARVSNEESAQLFLQMLKKGILRFSKDSI